MKVKIIGLLLATVSAGYAQELNESLSLRVVYEAKIRECYQRPQEFVEFSLDIWGDGASIFYKSKDPGNDEHRQIFAEAFGRKLGADDKNQHPMERYGENHLIIQKNYPKPDTLKQMYDFARNMLYYYEPIPAQDWQPEEGDTLIADYACQKARCNFRGRQWTVWYTLDIPYSNGPWKLGGLPGLILKADDATGDFSFTCISISTAKEKVVLPFRNLSSFHGTKEVTPEVMQREIADQWANVRKGKDALQFIFKDDQSEEEREAILAKLRTEKRTACLIEDFGTPKDNAAPKKKGRN